MVRKTKYLDYINNELPLADFIPYSSHFNENTLITKDGAFVRLFRLEGVSFETNDEKDLALAHQRLNSLYKGLAESNVSLWTHVIRRKITHRVGGTFDEGFSCQFNDRYSALFGEHVLVNDIYITVVQRSNSKRRTGLFNFTAVKKKLLAQYAEFEQVASRIQTCLLNYRVRPLSVIPSGISEPLTVLNYLLTGQWQGVRNPQGEISAAIGHAWISIDKDVIELEANSTTRYMQGLDIKEYSQESSSGMLDALLYTQFEFVLTQSFCFYTRKEGMKYLTSRERQLSNTGDGAITQIEAMKVAKNDLSDGQFAMGEYHFSIILIGDSLESVQKARAQTQKLLSDKDILSVPIKIATDAAFFAQLPANWQYRPRVAGMTSLNFASFSPFHNFLIGKREGNPWGDAVTRLNTLSGHPFFFNFHFTLEGDNNFGEHVAGNTRMVGMTGTGKTVALGLLFCQAQKFAENNPFSAVFFDKDRGAEVMIRALGGHYLKIQDGKLTGFNPFQMEPTPRNLAFLKRLVRYLLETPQYPLSIFDESRINDAVNTVMNMPSAVRCLSLLNQNISTGTSKEELEKSIKFRLDKWCVGGEFGWVFDNPVDELDFNISRNIGIDGTDFLDNDDVRTPISLYLLHKMEDIIDGRRFIYFMDEAWKWVNDPAFSEFVGNKQLTIRKQNGLGVFATQLPSSLLDSPQGAALVQSCSTEIYLPNPQARRDEYIIGFGLTEKEFMALQGMDEKSRLCLIKQGSNSAICSLNMPGMSDELTLLSAGAKELPLFEEATAEVGDNPSNWIPVFLSKVKAQKARSKSA